MKGIRINITLCISLIALMYSPALHAGQYKSDEVLIKFKDTASTRAFKNVKTDYNATPIKKYNINDTYLYRLPGNLTPAGAKKKLGKDVDIEYIEPNYKLNLNKIPNDPQYPQQTGLPQIKAPEAWDIVTGNPNTVIAVIDTGVDYNHEDLAENMVPGYDFQNNDADPMDDNGHGTHVAGIIGAVGNNGKGISGVCWQTKIMPIKFTDSTGEGFVSNAIQGIQYAVNNGAKIINTSWGGSDYSQSLYEAIETANAQNVLLITTAGNDAKNIDTNPTYPACYNLPNIIVVGAADENGTLASFSNYGTNNVDILAPGVNILSTLPDNQYNGSTGTSAAAPFVSGACALIMAKYPELTNTEVKARLLSSYKLNVQNVLTISAEQIQQIVFVKGGKFYQDAAATQEIIKLTIKAGTNQVSFYYMDDTIGTKTLIANTLEKLGYDPATQTINITGSGVPEEQIKARVTAVPVVNAQANLVFQPNAGGTTVLISGSFTETDPNTNDFYVKINGGAYGSATAGDTNTASPSAQITAVGATLDGNDYVSGVKIVHTDDFSNVGTNENTSLADSLKYVKPYTPSTPAVSNSTATTVDVTVNPNPSEVSGLEHAIYEENQDKYVQADGTLGASAVWQILGIGAGQWGNTTGETGKITVNKYASGSWIKTSISGRRKWVGITSSSDGTKLAACASSCHIYTSTDSGATWIEQTSSGKRGWTGITSSSDGTKLVACSYNGSSSYIYTSTDSGETWTQRTSAGDRNWSAITSSSDGAKLAACVNSGGYIYTSTDGGVTWTERTSAGSRYWSGITSSSDGTKLAACASGYIYTSTDSGVTWTERTSSGNRGWYGITSSSDGTKLAACVSGNYVYTSTDSGATWTTQTSAGLRDWIEITSSSDGIKLAACHNGGYIYTSTDSGLTWTQQTSSGSRYWRGLASSSDGAKLATCVYEGYIYTSTDSGATWTGRTPYGGRYWTGITSSSDGTKLVACAYSGGDYIYTSTDSGATWTGQTSAGSRNWYGITSSSDGIKLAACVNSGYIYTSNDSGVTWTERQVSGATKSWWGIASSSDGTKLAAYVLGGYIYTSTDSGATWTEQTSSGSRSWRGITSSSDGTKLAACVYADYIYTSTDSGVTWTQQTNPGFRNWYGITSSSDGTKLAAHVYNGYIYTSTDSGATWTERNPAGTIKSWYGITSSSDGTKLTASANNGYVYTSTDSGVTWTEQTSAGSRYWGRITSSSDGTKIVAAMTNGGIYTNYTNTTDYLFKVKSRNSSDGSNNSTSRSVWSNAGILDTTAPAVDMLVYITSQANTGDTTVVMSGSFTETSPNTNNFYIAINGGAYGSATSGTANTPLPADQTMDLGATLDGDDYITGIKIVHTDDNGNIGTNELTGTDIPVGVRYIKPYTPSAPSITNPTATTVDVVINPGSETGSVKYAIYETTQSKYVQADGSLNTSAVWQLRGTAAGQWGNNTGVSGKVRVTGLTNSIFSYSFKVKAINPNDPAQSSSSQSEWSDTSSYGYNPVFTSGVTSGTWVSSGRLRSDGSDIDVGFPSSYERRSTPTFADLDSDGDLDMIIGCTYDSYTNWTTTLLYYKNTGTNTVPVWTLNTSEDKLTDASGNVTNSSNTTLLYGVTAPSFADIDNDGDLDMAVGEYYGYIYFYQNTGNNTKPEFTLGINISGLTNPNGQFIKNDSAVLDVGSFAKPAFADLDNDGKVDLSIGQSDGYVYFYKNTGTTGSPIWTLYTSTYATNNGLPVFTDTSGRFVNTSSALIDIGTYSAPSLVDINNDGKIDMLIGTYLDAQGYYEGRIYCYINNIGDNYPKWLLFTNTSYTDSYGRIKNSSGTTISKNDSGYYKAPAFADLDNDGDMDLVAGNAVGQIYYYQNTGDDANGPASPSISIDEGANTTSANVSLTISASGSPSYMKITNYLVSPAGDTINATPGRWEAYSTTKYKTGGTPGYWTLPTNLLNGQSPKVTVNFADASYKASARVSDTITANFSASLPAPVGSLSGSFNGTQVSLSWTDNSTGGTGVTIERSIDGAAYSALTTLAAGTTSYNDTDVSAGKAYKYRIKLTNANGDSTWTETTVNLNRITWSNTTTSGSWVSSGILQSAGANVYGYYICGNLADLDNDGDLDLMTATGYSGTGNGKVYYYKNTGTNTVPIFEKQINSAGLTTAGSGYLIDTDNNILGSTSTINRPVFADINNDGRIDLVLCCNGTAFFYKNTGTVGSPRFTLQKSISNFTGSTGFFLTSLGANISYTDISANFGDLDNDGDLDMVIGENAGKVYYYENTGTTGYNSKGIDTPTASNTTRWTRKDSLANVTNASGQFIDTNNAVINVSMAEPVLVDLDYDGDLDLVVSTTYYKNTGTASSPRWTRQDSVTGLTSSSGVFSNVNGNLFTAFGDLDNDGDLDLIRGSQNYGSINYTQNTANDTRPSAPTFTVPASTTTNTINIDFSDSSNKTFYTNYLLSPAGDTIYAGQGKFEAFSASKTGWLLPANAYYGQTCYVRAKYANNNGYPGPLAGQPVTLNYTTAKPAPAVDLSASVSGGQINLSWTDVSGETSYTIERSVDGGAWTAINSPVAGSSSYSDTSLGGRYYKYRIKATNANGDSDWIYVTTVLVNNTWTENITAGSWVTSGLLRSSGSNIDIGSNSGPILADVDSDGMIDIVIGNYDGNVRYYRNTSADNTSPVWSPANISGLTDANGTFKEAFGNFIDVGTYAKPSMGDLDNDGKLDLLIGCYDGYVYYYKNLGTYGTPVWVLQESISGLTNALGQLLAQGTVIDVGTYSAPTLADLNNDGDLDLVIGAGDGYTYYYRNDGTVNDPSWVKNTSGITNSSGQFLSGGAAINNGNNSAPVFADIDIDGKLDLVKRGNSELYFYKNTGTSSSPVWLLITGIPGLTDLSGKFIDNNMTAIYQSDITPVFFDLDNNGTLDMILGRNSGELLYYKNTGGNTNTLSPVSVTAPASTDTSDITLTLSANSAYSYVKISSYLLSQGADSVNVDSGKWVAYSSGTKSWTLPTNTYNGQVCRVTAQFADSNFKTSSYAVSNAITITSTKPAPPSPLTATYDSTNHVVNLSWTNVAGETSYMLERNEDFSPTWTEIAAGIAADSTTYADSAIQRNKYYKYRIKAVNSTPEPDASSDYAYTAVNLNIVKFQASYAAGTWVSSGKLRSAGSDIDVGYHGAPSFADLDGDGDLDMAVGSNSSYYRYSGSGPIVYYTNAPTTAISKAWSYTESSADGIKLAVTTNGGYIYTSDDSGITWNERTYVNTGGPGLALSSDGTKLVVCTYGGYIYTSTDSGIAWTQQTSAGSRYWRGIASSSDGTKLAVGVNGGYIYTSADSGVTWTPRDNSRNWNAIASSSDGIKLVACVYNGYIYTSSNSGETWTAQTSAGSRYWKAIASSSDGTKLAACVENGYIYTSTDSGTTWTQQTAAGSKSWWSIASSSDGTKLASCVFPNGYIYTSTDSGVNWSQCTSAGSRNWTDITSSSDGTKLFSAVSNGYIYTSTDSGATWTERSSIGIAIDPVWTKSTSGVTNASGQFIDNTGAVIQLSQTSIPAFSDIDCDGDLDMFVGYYDGYIYVYNNTGTVSSPQWTKSTSGITDSSGRLKNSAGSVIDVGSDSAPSFADLNNDGKLDMVLGYYGGCLYYYKNISSDYITPSWQLQTSSSGLTDGSGRFIDSAGSLINPTSYTTSASFVDLDYDGDLDMIVAYYYSSYTYYLYYKNTGTVSSPSWTLQTNLTNLANTQGQLINSAGSTISSYNSSYYARGPVTFTDLDNDGKLDMMYGDYYGYVNFLRGIDDGGTAPSAPLITVPASSTSSTVNLSGLSATCTNGTLAKMKLTNYLVSPAGDTIYANEGRWENYSATKDNWQLPQNIPMGGSAKVYISYLSNKGYASPITASSSITCNFNTAPTVGYSSDNVVLASQRTDGSGIVDISYKIKDAESNTCTLNSFEYNLNGAGWTTTGTGLSGFTGNKTSAATYGTASVQTFTYTLPASTNGSMQIRFTANDGALDSGYATSASFTADNVAPVIATPICFTTPPVAGTTITLDVAFTETNPGTNTYYYNLNAAGYISGAGDTNTANPSAKSFTGLNINGDDRFTGIKAVHTDDFGNTTTTEDTTIVYVKPYQPPSPTVGVGSLLVTVNEHSSEPQGVLSYAIYVSPAISGNNWIQADGTTGASAVWQTKAVWGTKSIQGYSSPMSQYYFQTKSRNYYNAGTESDLSSAASIGNSAPSGSITAIDQATDASGTLTFTVLLSDAQSDSLTLDSFKVNNAIPAGGLTGFTGNKSSSPSGIFTNFTFDTKSPTLINGSTSFKFRIYDGVVYSSYIPSDAGYNFVVDNTNPATLSTVSIAQPNSGATTLAVSGSFTETNPNTNSVYLAINGETYGGALAGPANTATLSGYVTSGFGMTLNGDDFISKIKILHTDDYGNSGTNENLTDVYVKPATPSTPTVNTPTASSVNVTINPVAGSTVLYAIQVNNTYWVQANGTLATSPVVWQTQAAWGTKTVTGLVSPVSNYSFKVKARNPRDSDANNPASQSEFSPSAGISNTSPVGGYTADNVIPAANCTQSASYDGIVTIRFRLKDAESNLCALSNFQYSIDNDAWTPADGVSLDTSSAVQSSTGAVNGAWKNNDGNKYSSLAIWSEPTHTIKFSTKDPAINNDMTGKNLSNVKIRFIVNDGVVNSSEYITSEAFSVNNTYSPAIGFDIMEGTTVYQKMVTLTFTALGYTHYKVFGDLDNAYKDSEDNSTGWHAIPSAKQAIVKLSDGNGNKTIKVRYSYSPTGTYYANYSPSSTGHYPRQTYLNEQGNADPIIKVSSVSPYTISSGSSTITWYTNVGGTYKVKYGANSNDPNSGNFITGANAQGSCAPYTSVSSVVNYADLQNFGTNLIHIFVTTPTPPGIIKTESVGITKDSGGSGPITNAFLTAEPSSGSVPTIVTFMVNALPSSSARKYEIDVNNDGRSDIILPKDKNLIQFTYHFPYTGQAILKVTDYDGNVKTASVNMNIAQGSAPTVSLTARTSSSSEFSSSAISGNAPLKVVFRPSGNFNSTDRIFSKYDYDFDGDGVIDYTTTKQGDVTTIYTESGSHTATVWGTDAGAFMNKATIPITVNPVSGAPTAVVSASSATGNIPFTVTLTHSGSSDTGGSIETVEYDFDGDGNYDWVSKPDNASDAISAQYTYREPGVYTTKLRVTDNSGLSDTATVTITAKSGALTPPSISSFADTTNNMGVGVPIPANVSIIGNITKARLDWNADGGWDIEKLYDTNMPPPSHEYESAGYYKVIAQVEDTNGLTGTTTFFVLVTSSPTNDIPIKVWLMNPVNGMQIYGGTSGAKTPLVGDAFPISRVSSAEFQWKLSTASWDTITASNKVAVTLTNPVQPPLFATLDTSGFTAGNSYDIRLKVVTTTGNTVYSTDDPYGAITVTVANSTTATYRYSTSAYNKPIMHQGLDFNERKKMEMNDGTRIEMPPGIFGSEKTFKAKELDSAEIPQGHNISNIGAKEFKFEEDGSNQTKINKWVKVTIPYTDDNDDGFVDNTNIKAENLVSYYYSTDSEWESMVSRVVVDSGSKTVTFYTNKF